MVTAELAELRGAIDGLQAVDVDALGDGELTDFAVGLEALASRLDAVRARTAAAIDARQVHAAAGAKSAAAWLAYRCGRAKPAMARLVRLGRRLRSMPATAAALQAGAIGLDHVAELARCAGVDPGQFAAYETTLVAHGRTMRFDDFVRVCAHWRQVVDPDGREDEAARRFARRHEFHAPLDDGSVAVQARLAPVGAATFVEELERLERDLFEADWKAAKAIHGEATSIADLSRSSAQRRADALVEMAARSAALGAGHPARPRFTALVDYRTLAGRVCELANGTVITPGELAPHLTAADIERVVFGPGNRVLEVGRRARFFTGALRRAIEVRDRRCTHPTCDTPADRCEVDHRIPYPAGGDTVQENGQLLCGVHNRDKANRAPPRARPPSPDNDSLTFLDQLRQRLAAQYAAEYDAAEAS